MPTAYTAKIEDDISFEEFVLTCARQFGALVSMKDETLDTEIPDNFDPHNNHYLEKIEEVKEELEKLQHITEGEAEEEAKREYEEQMKNQIDRLYKKRELRRKYEKMLSKVHAWEPPSKDHVELKNFMTQQLHDSIKHDCNEEIIYELMPNKTMTGREWIDFWTNNLQKDLEFYRKRYNDEVEMVKMRTKWVKQLKDSLK